MNDETTCKQFYGKCLHSCIHYNIHSKLLLFLTGKHCWLLSFSTCNLLWLL